MPTFSQSLEQSLHRALAIANERHHQYATLEHLLLSLIDDSDAAAVMRACSVDLDKLRTSLVNYLETEFENLVTDSGDDAKPTAVPESKDSALLIEWKAADAIRAWARLSPALAEVDLRPYLFVTKDRKDYFGAASVLGRLAAVVEKLLGPKLAVQAFEGELKQLVPAEAAQVFEELRGRVMGGDAFDTAPPGIDGLAVLVRAHPPLQTNLLDLLEALPADRCGPWPASGWEGVIKDADAVARFEKLLQKWSTSQSTFLKTTASAALRTRKGGR